ncbi:hypothetical protein BDV40DRAFT_267578 [Aspergillus tamarii]|uniref:Uncharacterized protein n=1 Tax=Aspergillus tamarii TaxID=41984 RepID=A0A5N6US40_ASPTM|nr:hypothetical protein BDV40DRAFT_267578 [Aspergillus tamarii]
MHLLSTSYHWPYPMSSVRDLRHFSISLVSCRDSHSMKPRSSLLCSQKHKLVLVTDISTVFPHNTPHLAVYCCLRLISALAIFSLLSSILSLITHF